MESVARFAFFDWTRKEILMHLFTRTTLAASVVALTPAAQASLFELQLSSGSDLVTVADGSILDLDPVDGQIIFSGAVGGIDSTITVGTSNSPGDGIVGASVSLTSLTLRNTDTSPVDLTIQLSDTDFSSPDVGSAGELISDLSLSQIESPVVTVDFTSSADASNVPFATSISAPTLELTDNGGLESSTSFTSPGPFSVTSTLNIAFDGPGTVTVTGNTVVLPEPTSLGMLAAGSVLLAARRRRK